MLIGDSQGRGQVMKIEKNLSDQTVIRAFEAMQGMAEYSLDLLRDSYG